MPIFTYTPAWEVFPGWFDKFKPFLPSQYTGLIGIRLHRTGYPLTVELFGKKIPEKPLYPVLVMELKQGKLVHDWAYIEDHYDVPWVKYEDTERYRHNVMSFYHAEDLLEPRAEEVLSQPADEAAIRKLIVDHAEVLV